MKPYLIILYFISITALGAAGDAFMDIKDISLGQWFEPVQLALVASGAFIFKLNRRHWLVFLIVFICFNIVGFDLIYNWIRDIPIFEMGTTKSWDKILSKINPIGVTFARVIFLWLGIGLIFKYLKE